MSFRVFIGAIIRTLSQCFRRPITATVVAIRVHFWILERIWTIHCRHSLLESSLVCNLILLPVTVTLKSFSEHHPTIFNSVSCLLFFSITAVIQLFHRHSIWINLSACCIVCGKSLSLPYLFLVFLGSNWLSVVCNAEKETYSFTLRNSPGHLVQYWSCEKESVLRSTSESTFACSSLGFMEFEQWRLRHEDMVLQK